MPRRWNLLLPAGFLLALAAFLSYFFFFAYFPVTRDLPWLNLLLFAAALALLGIGLKRAFRQPAEYRGKISGSIFATLSVLVLSLFLFYNFSLSKQLPASARAPQVGEKAPDFTLPDVEGNPVALNELVSSPRESPGGQPPQWVLLVFYRGYW